jgi:hypothetical protein
MFRVSRNRKIHPVGHSFGQRDCFLQCSDIFLKEFFEFFVSQHFIDKPENRLFVVPTEVLQSMKVH